MDDLTPEAVEAALDGATPGPWRPHCDEHGYTGEVHGGIGSEHEGCIADWVPERDAALIARAPALARDWLRLKKENKKLRAECSELWRARLNPYEKPQVQTAAGFDLSDLIEFHSEVSAAIDRAAVEGK